ncbi:MULTISPECIES: hypothetical protein [Mycolicibacterium]|uniref:hypothetical protein n=1 Tax=Mycolicibacterium TaxID=1866885 RepID=UPI0004323A7C|nr:hypothetical protein [Mycolicibacterium mageritense]MCC9183817.1 hypothetical protein [Mycolicibacterium mageritense]TXI62202.1 MAG: hypothetical protein E6Q55_13625 [Mycolicibacterium mageritense]CDO20728.1 hypothetical protein BN978_01185 [Mycolicibacterium mageritense DSM 44476 = CIP 104973]
MANDLEVDASGLRLAAAGSDELAAGFAAGSDDALSGSRRSSAGISALDVAINAVRGHQSVRISGQAGDMLVGAGRYDETDGDAARAVTVTV